MQKKTHIKEISLKHDGTMTQMMGHVLHRSRLMSVTASFQLTSKACPLGGLVIAVTTH